MELLEGTAFKVSSLVSKAEFYQRHESETTIGSRPDVDPQSFLQSSVNGLIYRIYLKEMLRRPGVEAPAHLFSSSFTLSISNEHHLMVEFALRCFGDAPKRTCGSFEIGTSNLEDSGELRVCSRCATLGSKVPITRLGDLASLSNNILNQNF